MGIHYLFHDRAQILLRVLFKFLQVFLSNYDFWRKLSLGEALVSNSGLQLEDLSWELLVFLSRRSFKNINIFYYLAFFEVEESGELLFEPPELLVTLLWRLFNYFLDLYGESVDFVVQLFLSPEHQEGSRARLLFFRGDCYIEVPYPHLQIVNDVTLLCDSELLKTAQQNLSEFLQALAA